jgi:tetratricopeptide (TPR) repeat protein/predicted Ser/Thr protein kinase
MRCPRCRFDNPSETRFCGKCGAPLPPEEIAFSQTETVETPLKELTTGSTFARRYQVIEELGRGGMGRVYKALDSEIKDKVALKVLKPEIASDGETIARFRNELRLARRISHKNVCRMYDLNHEQGTQFITMEYVEGENLKSLMRRMGPFSVGKAASVARQVCEGLAEAHRLGVVHRDLKPQNIMIDNEGNVRIMDFGIARSLKGKGITDTRVMIGTPEYMSPEQVEGAEVDGRADIYALGIILYELLTGKVPFEGDTALSVALKQKTELPRDPRGLNPQVPEAFSSLILRCLEKDKAKRYGNVEALISDLDTIEAALTPTSGIVRPASFQRSRRKRVLIAAVAAVAVLAVAAAAFFFVGPGRLDVDPNRVVVAPFENRTGDPSLDSVGGIAADWITQGISQAAQIEVVPAMAVQESFEVVEKERGRLEGITWLRALARETRAGIVVSGTYYLQGEDLQFQANITDVQKKKLVYALPSVSGNKDDPMEVVKVLQQRLMGTIATYYDVDLRPFLGASPPNFEAYQEYWRGLELFGKDYARCYEHMNKALELDPTFLMPKSIIATGYHNQDNYEKAKEIFEELNRERTHLDQFTRFWTDSMLADMAGRLEESLRYSRQAASLTPKSAMTFYNLGLVEYWLNRPRKAIEEFSKIDLKKANLTRFGSGSWVFSIWAGAYHMLGKYKKELEIVKRGEEYFPDRVWFLAVEARSYAARGKIDMVRDVIRRSLTTADAETTPGDVMYEAAIELRTHGHPDESKRIADESVDWYRGRPAEEAAEEQNRYYLAHSLYLAEHWGEARDICEALRAEKPENVDYQGFTGVLAARLGDKERALQVSGELRALTKPYLFGNHTYWRACIASLLGNKEEAVALLREAFSQGKHYGVGLHRDLDLESLRDYPPFQELLKPKG